MSGQVYRAVGLMSGTSLDGVDAVRLATDGENRVAFEAEGYVEYPAPLRARVLTAASGDMPLSDVLRLERDLTELYVAAARTVMADGVAVVGCHGQTIRHLPEEGLTWQLGDPNRLAEGAGMPVVMDFRRRDMAAGGQGAPLVPLYHAALLTGHAKPCGVLNIGGVANLTWLAEGGKILASDCGPGVGLLNSLCEQRLGVAFDKDGALAGQGKVHAAIVRRGVEEIPFRQRPLPRSADRYEFQLIMEWVAPLSDADAAATLCAITAGRVRHTLEEIWNSPPCAQRRDGEAHTLPSPRQASPGKVAGPLAVVGGGARHPGMMAALRECGLDAVAGEVWGLRGQTLEAEAFAWLAVRRLRGLPLTLPETTGARRPTVGGVLTA
jgi:anhydro-N-acetylmuramic acid kinase